MSNNCNIYFWDVQHGHATYIRTPNNRHIVVDLGTGDYSGQNAEFSPLRHINQRLGVERLDYVIITHPHRDHIDDILNLDGLSPKVLNRPKHLTHTEIMAGVSSSDKPKFDAYCSIDLRYNQSISKDSEDDTSNPHNWGGLGIKSFTPTSCSHSNFNNHSIVSVFEFVGLKVVVPGDNEKISFDELMMKPEFR